MVETVALLPLHGFQVNTRGTGHAQFPPSMMLALLVYNYAGGQARAELHPDDALHGLKRPFQTKNRPEVRPHGFRWVPQV